MISLILNRNLDPWLVNDLSITFSIAWLNIHFRVWGISGLLLLFLKRACLIEYNLIERDKRAPRSDRLIEAVVHVELNRVELLLSYLFHGCVNFQIFLIFGELVFLYSQLNVGKDRVRFVCFSYFELV